MMKKKWNKSKGIIFGGLSLLLILTILFVEIDGLPSVEIWPNTLPDGQWFKVISAGLSLVSCLGQIWGRIVARGPIAWTSEQM